MIKLADEEKKGLEKSPDKPASESSSEVDNKGEGSSTKTDEIKDKNVPFNEHPRFREVIQQKNEAIEKAQKAQEALLESNQKYSDLQQRLTELETKHSAIADTTPDYVAPEDLIRQQQIKLAQIEQDIKSQKIDVEKSKISKEWAEDEILQAKWKSPEELQTDMLKVARENGFTGNKLTEPRDIASAYILLKDKHRKDFIKIARELEKDNLTKSKEMAEAGGLPGKGFEKANEKVEPLTDAQKRAAAAFGVSEDKISEHLKTTSVDDRGRIITEFTD